MSDQQTLRAGAEFAGVGLHTGRDARVRVEPAAPDSGLVFVLDDVVFPAVADYVVDTSRATVLGSRGRTVSTVEHLLSALVGVGVDNARIVVEGPEIPVLDGSALPFVDAFAKVGVEPQGRRRARLPLPELVFEDGDKSLRIVPADALAVDVTIDFRPPIGRQRYAGAITGDVYVRDVAPARTFGYLDEVEALRARGLAMGGSLDNAIVFDADGPLKPLRVADEPVRHKVLDLLGDFALAGVRLDATIVAYKSGHALHARAVQHLRSLIGSAAV